MSVRGAAERLVTGPRLVRRVRPGTAPSFGRLWLAVARAGGAVSFPPDGPEPDVRSAAEQVIAEVRAGRQHLIVIESGHELVGTVLLAPGTVPVMTHRAKLGLLMIHPDLQRQGWGSRLLAAAVEHATALGLEQLVLSTRSATGLPEYYAAHGWTEVGRIPDALRLGPDDYRDEVWMQLRLRPSCP